MLFYYIYTNCFFSFAMERNPIYLPSSSFDKLNNDIYGILPPPPESPKSAKDSDNEFFISKKQKQAKYISYLNEELLDQSVSY